MYSKRILQVKESATLKLNSMVTELKKKGEKICNLTAGEPDFDPPMEAQKAILQALEEHKNKYTPVPGIMELRKAVADYTNKTQSNLKNPWNASHVIISNGAKQALYNALTVLLNESDEVIFPAPYWISYPEMVQLAGGVSVILETKFENHFKFTAEDLRKKITPKTKVLILNSPSNPTGVIFNQSDFKDIAKVLMEYKERGQKIWVFSDEIYEQLIYGQNSFCSFLNAAPELQDQVVTFNGMSKSFAMTGWRVGWSVAPLEITGLISNLQGQSTSGVNSLAQSASFAALTTDQTKYFQGNLSSLEKKRKLVLDIFANCGRIKVCQPDGAFYFFLDVSEGFQEGEDSVHFSEALLSKKKVAVVPGTPFGAPHFIRISFATDENTIREGCERIKDFISA